MKLTIAILKSESAFDHDLWVIACKKNANIKKFDIIDLTADDWFSQINQVNYDLFLLRPPGSTELFKRLYDERVFVISSVLQKKIYPTLSEVFIHENKRLLRDWLLANNIPHPKTFVSFDEKEALAFINSTEQYPLVGKTNIGASGSGVAILKSKEESLKYVVLAFGSGVKSKSGPKLFKGSILKKLHKLISKKNFIKERLKEYSISANKTQKEYLILQEYVPHLFEWRCVRIGDSFFAHKKIAVNNKSSGTLIKDYDSVPEKLLDFIKEISDKTNLFSVAIDVFEREDEYLVNEVQCFFGQSDPYQMLVKGKPGRYIYRENAWIFEEGMFNTNQSYDLRLAHAITYIK
ncbi:MAG: hypothetical protein K8S18_00195 [Desulfobacula sp.]|nr:hypothetical protein [Desulfobacula sp.]